MQMASKLSYSAVGSICFGIVGIVGNLMTCIVIASHKPLRSRLSNYFLINQSVIDLLLGVLILIIYTSNLENLTLTGLPQLIYCMFWKSHVFLVGLFYSSSLCVMAITVERYVEVVHPILHRTKVTKRHIVYSLVGIWVGGMLFKIMFVLPVSKINKGACIINFGGKTTSFVPRIIGFINFIGEYCLPLAVICFSYVKMISKMRSRVQPFQLDGKPASTTYKIRRNLLKTLLTVVIFMVVCNTMKQVKLKK